MTDIDEAKLVDKIINSLENNLSEWQVSWEHYYNKNYQIRSLCHPVGLGLVVPIGEHRNFISLISMNINSKVKVLDNANKFHFKSKKEEERLLSAYMKAENSLKEQQRKWQEKEQVEKCKRIIQEVQNRVDLL